MVELKIGRMVVEGQTSWRPHCPALGAGVELGLGESSQTRVLAYLHLGAVTVWAWVIWAEANSKR